LLFKRMLGKIFLCLVLGFASLSGLTMDPKKIEELMHAMNQTRIEVTIPEQDDQGDLE
jgi:hypothetical protein